MPYANEHAARLVEPSKFEADSFRRTNDKFGAGIHAIFGKLKGESTMTLQTIRFDASKFTAAEAKGWLKDHDYKPILFEPASGDKEEKNAMNRWFTCEAKPVDPKKEDGEQTCIVDIFDEIGGWGINAKMFIEAINAQEKAKGVHLRINSPGGSVYDGLAIYNFLRNCGKTVTAEVYGLCGSIASVVAMAASKVSMPSNSFLMIHNPVGGLVEGGSDDMRKVADLLDQMSAMVAKIYAQKTGKTPEECRKLMDAETWMDGDTALKEGFCDECTDALAIAALAKLDVRGATKIPEAIINARNEATKAQQTPVEPTLSDLLNKQVTNELAAGYRYLMIGALCQARGLEGFEQRFTAQAEDEFEHAMRVYRYLMDTGTVVALGAVPAPDIGKDATLASLTEIALAMEKSVTADWQKIAGLAGDPASKQLAQDFATLQVAEESEAATLNQRVGMAGNEGSGLLLIDAELKGIFAKAKADADALIVATGIKEVEATMRASIEAEIKAKAAKPVDPREEFKSMASLCGEERAGKYFAKGLTLDQCKDALIAELRAELGKSKALNTELETKLETKASNPLVPFQPSQPGNSKTMRVSEEAFEAYCKANRVIGKEKEDLRAALSRPLGIGKTEGEEDNED